MRPGSINTAVPRFEATPTRQQMNHQHHHQQQRQGELGRPSGTTRFPSKSNRKTGEPQSGFQQVLDEPGPHHRGNQQPGFSSRTTEVQGMLNSFQNPHVSGSKSKQRTETTMKSPSNYPTFGLSTTESTSTTDSRETDKRCLPGELTEASPPVFGRVCVELIRGKEDSLGLTVSGGTDQGEPPCIASIRLGSIADKSDCLLVSDRILSINNTSTSKLRHDENIRLAKSAGLVIQMEIEYELPELPPAGCTVKHMAVDLEARASGFGLVIRGGWSKQAMHVRPLTVMHVRPNSTAECDGRIKPGDRILSINSMQTGQLTCEEANRLVTNSKPQLSLLIEYNVANFDADRSISGAVIVEIEKPGNEDLGVSLAPCHEVRTGQNAFFINFIRQGSIADRCGALFTGDRVEAIDGVHVEQLTLQGAMLKLKHNGLSTVRLQIVPNAMIEPERPAKTGSTGQKKGGRASKYMWPISSGHPRESSRVKSQKEQNRTTFGDSSVSIPTAQRSICATDTDHMEKMPISSGYPVGFRSQDEVSRFNEAIGPSMLASLPNPLPISLEVCRCEEVVVCLTPDENQSYGFRLCSPTREHQVLSRSTGHVPLVYRIEPGGAAYRSGVLQEGDRVLAINGQSTKNLSITRLTAEFLQPPASGPPPTLTMLTEYSIADTVVPTSGVFDVKLVRRTANLGINLQASINKRDGQPLLISKVIPGSVARRSGSISPGDTLLAVNGIPLSSCSLAEAISLLQSQDDEIVTLRIEKRPDYLRDMIPMEVSTMASSQDPPERSQKGSRYRRGTSLPETGFCASSDLEGDIRSSAKYLSTSDYRCKATYGNMDLGGQTSVFQSSSNRPLNGSPSRLDAGMQSGAQKYSASSARHEQPPGDRSTSSGPEEMEIQPAKTMDKPCKGARLVKTNQIPASDETEIRFSPQVNTRMVDETSPEDGSQSDELRVVRVVLRRKSSDCPWGIIICGTDEASNAPVLIDSLHPGSPSAVSGLIHPGDRLLAINSSVLHAGHTLSQAMRMLQQHPDKVVLHLARPTGNKAGESGQPVGTSESEEKPTAYPQHAGDAPFAVQQAIDQDVSKTRGPMYHKSEEYKAMRYVTLKKVSSLGNFSRSFDSITNSINSNTPTTAASETLPLRQSRLESSSNATVERPARVTRPRSITSLQPANPEASTNPQPLFSRGRELTDEQEMQVYSQMECPSRMRKNVPAVSVRPDVVTSELTRIDQPSAGIERQAEAGQWISSQQNVKGASAYRSQPMEFTQDFSCSDDGGDGCHVHRSSDTSDALEALTTDPPGSSYLLGVSYCDITDQEFEAIQCPGCREAILNERRQRRQMKSFRNADNCETQLGGKQSWHGFIDPKSEPKPDEIKKQCHSRRRARSYHDETVFREQTPYTKEEYEKQARPHQDKPASCQHACYSEMPSGLRECPSSRPACSPHQPLYYENAQAESYTVQDQDRHPATGAGSRDVTSLPAVRHSKSDSGLNLAGILSSTDTQDNCFDNHSIPSKPPVGEVNKGRGTTAPQSPRRMLASLPTASHLGHMSFHLDSSFPQRRIRREVDQRLHSNRPAVDQTRSVPTSHVPEHAWSISTAGTSPADNFDRPISKPRRDLPGQCEVWCSWIRLTKASPSDSYGIGVSEGVSTRGVFISAIRPGSPADRSGQLHLYDRILMVNDILVEGHSGSEIISHVSRSERFVDLLIQRRIPRQRMLTRERGKPQSSTEPHQEERQRSHQQPVRKLAQPQVNLTSL